MTGDSATGNAADAATPTATGVASKSAQMSSNRAGVKSNTSPDDMSVAFRTT